MHHINTGDMSETSGHNEEKMILALPEHGIIWIGAVVSRKGTEQMIDRPGLIRDHLVAVILVTLDLIRLSCKCTCRQEQGH